MGQTYLLKLDSVLKRQEVLAVHPEYIGTGGNWGLFYHMNNDAGKHYFEIHSLAY